MTIQQLLQQAQQRLSVAPGLQSEDQYSAAREAQLLLAHTLGCQRSYLIAYPELEPADNNRHAYLRLIERRCQGEPVAYLIGHKEFYGINLEVNTNVLIPRPETELLVDHALELLPDDGSAVDLGTGSGAIAIALAKSRHQAQIIATDLSTDALTLARSNAQKYQLNNILFYDGHWFDALPHSINQLDMIVSNPPYVEAGDQHLSQGDCRFEPTMALTPGKNSTSALQSIIEFAPKYLKHGGWLLLEHGFDQAEAVRQYFQQGPWGEIRNIVDLAGQPRVSLGKMMD